MKNQRVVRYRPRVVDGILKRNLQAMGAVLIEGPKLCGKSTTAAQQAGSAELLQEGPVLELADLQPQLLLEGATPRLLDEWQLAPRLWDAVRREVDRRGGAPGQFILTGSSVPADRKGVRHTGTGRFAWVRMRPMTLFESGDAAGGVRLSDLFAGADVGKRNELGLQEVAFAACRGGWPTALGRSEEIALEPARAYFEAVVRHDVSRVDGVSRDEGTFRRLMRSYARMLGTQTSNAEMAKDVGVHVQTVTDYLTVLQRIFVVEEMPAWNPNLRSKTAIRTADTRYFADPSIAAAALEIGPNDLLRDPETFGFVFETLCVRDLRVYAEALNGSLFHYRDGQGLECDAVLHRRDGSYGLIEIKLGSSKGIEDGVRTLTKLSEKIDTSRMPAPSFRMILTAVGDYAYRRPDGILIVPIGCLEA